MIPAAFSSIALTCLVLLTANPVLSGPLGNVSMKNATTERYNVSIELQSSTYKEHCSRILPPGDMEKCGLGRADSIRLRAQSESNKGSACEQTTNKPGAFQVVAAASSCRIEQTSVAPPTGVVIVENKSDEHVVYGFRATGWSVSGSLPPNGRKEIDWPTHVTQASFNAMRVGNPSCSTTVSGPGTVVTSGALSCTYTKK